MDGAPATPPKEVAAIHAPAPDARAGLGYVSVRAGLGVGAGNRGLAGTYFGSAELWPWYFLGIGGDLSRAKTAKFRILGPPLSDSIEAVRGTLSLRLPLRKPPPSKVVPFLEASLGIGPALRTRLRGDEPEESDSEESSWSDSCWFCWEIKRRTTEELAVLAEAGVYARLWKVEFGGGFRLDIAGQTTIVTGGPSAGFQF